MTVNLRPSLILLLRLSNQHTPPSHHLTLKRNTFARPPIPIRLSIFFLARPPQPPSPSRPHHDHHILAASFIRHNHRCALFLLRQQRQLRSPSPPYLGPLHASPNAESPPSFSGSATLVNNDKSRKCAQLILTQPRN